MKEELEKTKRDLKRLTFVCFFLLMAHCGLLILGYKLPFAEIVTVCTGFYFVYLLSHRIFKLCFVMRFMIFFNYVCFCCVWIERYHGFGKYLTLARATMFSIGMLLLTGIIHMYCKKKIHI